MYDTALIGLGRIASKYSSDKKMQQSLDYYTHAQVLKDHKDFNCIAAVDPSKEAREYANKTFDLDSFDSIDKIENKERIEVLVLATPPERRLEAIKSFPFLKAVIVEKPLGISYKESLDFIVECEKRNILVTVNLTRRSDLIMKGLSDGELLNRIGKTQFVFGTYGRGVRNYATHLIDLSRMLIGEIKTVQVLSNHLNQDTGPIDKDLNLSFKLKTINDVSIIMQPLDFSFYREGGLDIWGEKGRIQIIQEGLKCVEYSMEDCRSLDNAKEIAIDKSNIFKSGYGDALYNLYENLSDSISKKTALDSPGRSALNTELIVESLFKSFQEDGKEISCL
tara:strand:- start:519 stop:1526 length:1008 start_codon:yes stop_codon:yes gene_type:complete